MPLFISVLNVGGTLGKSSSIIVMLRIWNDLQNACHELGGGDARVIKHYLKIARVVLDLKPEMLFASLKNIIFWLSIMFAG